MESKDEKGHFRLINKTAFKSLEEGSTISESDLCFQDEENIYQFEFIEPKKEYKEKIKPGTYALIEKASKITTKAIELRSRDLLSSITNTKAIIDESDLFFNNLNVYEELGEPKARKILLCSDPGMGKTAAITGYSQTAIDQDDGTVVLVWPTAEIDSSDVSNFLSKFSEYDPKCSRMVLIMEDIGGGEREFEGNRSVDSAMLDLLDGLQVTFKLPTLIIATTNYPQNLLSALADRPGRFDLIMQLKPPSKEERIALVEFFGKEAIDDKAKAALDEHATDFSIAHLKEVVIRSRLHKKHIADIVTEVKEHRDRFKRSFEEKDRTLGFGI